ncbi:MAG TPA: hypothetical protein VM716_04455 [Gemmatimonadales bacterium]|nr:hypothetical protein [Gemmatimonadales bacterium]
MSRTILTAVLFVGLVACGGRQHSSKRAAASASREATAPHTTGKYERQQQKKKGTKPDTTRAKNPLTN